MANVSENKKHVTYDEIHYIIEKSKHDLIRFKPDVVVGVCGGGAMPSRNCRRFLNVPLITITISSYDNNDNKLPTLQKLQWFDENSKQLIKGKRVLLVDEVDDTRRTLLYIIKELRQENPGAIGIFVVHNKKKDKDGEIPDDIFYKCGEEVEDDWIIYPWEAPNYKAHLLLAQH